VIESYQRKEFLGSPSEFDSYTLRISSAGARAPSKDGFYDGVIVVVLAVPVAAASFDWWS